MVRQHQKPRAHATDVASQVNGVGWIDTADPSQTLTAQAVEPALATIVFHSKLQLSTRRHLKVPAKYAPCRRAPLAVISQSQMSKCGCVHTNLSLMSATANAGCPAPCSCCLLLPSEQAHNA